MMARSKTAYMGYWKYLQQPLESVDSKTGAYAQFMLSYKLNFICCHCPWNFTLLQVERGFCHIPGMRFRVNAAGVSESPML